MPTKITDIHLFTRTLANLEIAKEVALINSSVLAGSTGMGKDASLKSRAMNQSVNSSNAGSNLVAAAAALGAVGLGTGISLGSSLVANSIAGNLKMASGTPRKEQPAVPNRLT